MNQTTFYRESQNFRQWWMKVVISVNAIGAIIIESYIMRKIVMGTEAEGLPGLLLFQIVALFLWSLSLFLYSLRLDTKVDSSGLYVKFRPLHRGWRVFQFEGIQSCETVRYRPLFDYGGWGIRYSRKGKAYTVSGDSGIELVLKRDIKRTVIVGSQRSQELSQAVNDNLTRI